MLEPKEGVLTFRAEGNNIPGSQYYSRVIHWPGNSSRCAKNASGVTIGRGFDLGSRSESEAYGYLTRAGIPSEKAMKISAGKKLTHCRAYGFVSANKEQIEEITEPEQLRLFEIVYRDYIIDSNRFYNKYKRSEAVQWDKLHQEIKDVFVDMKYQGVLSRDMVNFFERNDKDSVIQLIKSNKRLMDYEDSRNRIKYLKDGR